MNEMQFEPKNYLNSIKGRIFSFLPAQLTPYLLVLINKKRNSSIEI